MHKRIDPVRQAFIDSEGNPPPLVGATCTIKIKCTDKKTGQCQMKEFAGVIQKTCENHGPFEVFVYKLGYRITVPYEQVTVRKEAFEPTFVYNPSDFNGPSSCCNNKSKK